MENFWGTKSWRKILEELKWKVDISIKTKNVFNPKKKIALQEISNISRRLNNIWIWIDVFSSKNTLK